MLIYKIFRGPEWAQLEAKGETYGAQIDLDDGFIHLSGPDTVVRTAELYFANMDDLVLVAIEADDMDDLSWEASRGGDLFPHLYRPMRMQDVVWHKPLPIIGGTHHFPANL